MCALTLCVIVLKVQSVNAFNNKIGDFLSALTGSYLYAVIGVTLSYWLPKVKNAMAIFCGSLLLMGICYCLPITNIGELSVKILLFSIFSFVIFYFLPITKGRILIIGAKYGLGIYCLHIVVSVIVTHCCNLIGNIPHPLMYLMTYILSLAISVIIASLPIKKFKMLVS